MNQRPTARCRELFPDRIHSVAPPHHDSLTGSSEAADRPTVADLGERPNIARVHNYFLGGKDYFADDRLFAHKILELAPRHKRTLHANRAFVTRAARHLVARRGVRQLIEVGMGFPVQRNLHQVAQGIDPDARVVYVDTDPVVLSHARALLATNDRVKVVEGQAHDPYGFLNHQNTRELIDFTRPVAVVLAGSLQFVPSTANPCEAVFQMCGALPPGSYLVLTHPATRPETLLISDLFREHLGGSQPPLAREQMTALFRGLALEPPGVVPVSGWQPDLAPLPGGEAWFYAGVGRIPLRRGEKEHKA
ncbi:SAM-dependent methyltransferase [Actinomadura meridiana]|uniref:SAM-dependent methyltransferase n=1 Tax=Actinomadura meridiana TaxID=559626 RepID=A0ABP8BRN2_9ACTN